MSKYIKSFENATEMANYLETAEGGKYYLLKNNTGTEGIGLSPSSGKRIVSVYKSQHEYLTFTAVDAGATVKYNASTNTTAEYSTDGGTTWTDAVGVTVTLTNVGDKVKYRGVISGNISSSSVRFKLHSSKKVAASGSIMSMYNNNPDDTTIVYEGAFQYMFFGCSSLTSAPELPATTLASNCYSNMFDNCTSLTVAPELPATTLDSNCYSNMFNNCTSLTVAPELPATTLALQCYQSMFYRCTSLTVAPELPATTLASNCYSNMFNNCTSLTSVTHHITNWNTSGASNWLSGVAANGTVICPAASTIPADNASGVPTGWTRVDL